MCFGSLIHIHLFNCFPKLEEAEFILVWKLSVFISQLFEVAHVQICIHLVGRLEIAGEEVAKQDALRGEHFFTELKLIIAASKIDWSLSADYIYVW